MNDLETRVLRSFEQELSSIVGADLAHTLLQYGRAPTPLEETLLRSDGVAELSSAQRQAAVDLIDAYFRR